MLSSCKSCLQGSSDPLGFQCHRLSQRPLKEKRILHFEMSTLVFNDKMRKKNHIKSDRYFLKMLFLL